MATLGASVGLVLVLPLLLLALPFLAVSAAVRFFARATEPEVASRGEVMEFDSVLGWRMKPGLSTHYEVRRDDIYPIQTDAFGWAGTGRIEESDVLVVGDSFASGYGARPGTEFWQRAPDLRIKTVGCPGYDMVQEVLVLRLLGPRMKRRLILWFVYLENDIADSLRPHWRGYRKPFACRSATTGNWEIVERHVREAAWTHSTHRDNFRLFPHLCVAGSLSDHYYSACEFLVGSAAGICRKAGADLVLMTIPNVHQLHPRGHRRVARALPDPTAFDPGYPDRRFAEICGRTFVPFVPAMPVLRSTNYKPWEKVHWTPAGHRKVAVLIRRVHEMWRAGRLDSAVPAPPPFRAESATSVADATGEVA